MQRRNNPAFDFSRKLARSKEIGSIEVGKRADLVLLGLPNLLHLAYHYGINLVAAVIKAGRPAATRQSA